MDKILKLLEIAKKFGVKPSKVIGTQGNVVPLKKPSLVEVNVDEFKLKESIDSGAMTMDKVQQEIEETVRLALSKNLNDVELNRALNNAVNIERQFFPPVADVIAAGSGKQVTGKGLEELIDKEGLMAPPNTPLGKADFQIKRAKQSMEDIKNESDIGNLIKGAGRDQLAEIKLHNEGLVRAVTRQILSEDIKAGKIKSLTLDDLGTSREPIDYFRKIYGENALEQLDSLIPDFNRLNTEQEAANLARSKFKFEPDEFRLKGSTSYEDVEKAKTTEKEKGFFERLFGPKKQEKEPAEVLDITTEGNKRKSVDELIDEYNANQDRTRLLDERGENAISYEEFQDIQKKNEKIAKELEIKGVKSTPEPEEVKEEGIVIPFRKKFTKPEPEGKAQGGIIGYALGGRTGYSGGSKLEGILDVVKKDYDKSITKKIIDKGDEINETAADALRRQIESRLTDEQRKKMNRFLGIRDATIQDIIKDSSSEGSPRAIKRKEEADGGRIGFNKGKRVLDLIAEANKKLKDKKSMESVNPQTGEVTVPKEPIKTAEEPTGMTTMDPEPEIIDEKSITTKQQTKSRQLTDNEIADYEEQIGRNAEEWLSEGTVDEAEKALKSSKAEEAYYRREYISGKLNPVPGEKTEDRLNFLRKKFEEASMVKDKKLFGKDELNELLDLEVMYSQKTETPVIKNRALDSFLKVLNTDRLELERIQQKYTGVIDDSFLKEILLDPNPQSRAEIMAQIDESLTMQQKGMSEEEIIDVLDKTKRTKQARGGTAGGLDYLMGF